MNDRHFTISMHILTLLAKKLDQWLPSAYIAGSLNLNPVIIRTALSKLQKQGFIETKEGKNGGSRLVRSPEKILLSEIYLSVYNQTSIGKLLPSPNPECCVGKKINQNISELNLCIEKVVFKQLEGVTLQDFSMKF
ncbi:MAG: Rrf2 family transcriptional regulator [Apibacter sp.]|nr:Rrf2 family transcriptional regulator [Apibacter sp.]